MMTAGPQISPYRLCIASAVIVSLVLAGCSSQVIRPTPITEPMKINKQEHEITLPGMENKGAAARDHLSTSSGPATPVAKLMPEPIATSTAPPLSGEPISINFDSIRLPAFVNTVFGELLKVTFEIDSTVNQRDQLVTLRTAEPLPPNKFLHLVEEVLANYGISVVYSNGVYRIIEAASVKQSVPRIVRTRAIPQMPSEMRPIFYFQPLNNISNGTMMIWLQIALKDRVQAITVPNFNGLLLLGNNADVTAATEIIHTLDQPFMAGAKSVKISPAFWSASKLAHQLADVLTAEGYSISVGAGNPSAVRLLPIDALNIIIAFGTGEEALQHVVQWAADLDQPGQTVGSQGVFYHQVYNAKAKDLADIVKGLLDQGASLGGNTTNPAQTAAPPGSESSSGTKQRIVVDEPRNGLIFLGTAEEYSQFRALVSQMDRAPLQVMIEATVAEVTLNNSESLGVTLGYDTGSAAAVNRTTATSGATGLFYSIVRSNGELTASLSSLASQNRVQILSSPRIVTSSGKTAAISVGNDVPIVTAQETAPGQVNGSSSLLQSIQYRSTGIILNVEPTINSNRRVELTVGQEVSSASTNDTSSVSSPVILKRSIKTTLSLDDGQTVLLGGLISETYTEGDSGIPYLKDVPILGNLFKKQSKSTDRSELIVLLTPYIIDSSDTAAQIRDGFRSQLSQWAQGQIAKQSK
jgi:general secretion pathway protein D